MSDINKLIENLYITGVRGYNKFNTIQERFEPGQLVLKENVSSDTDKMLMAGISDQGLAQQWVEYYNNNEHTLNLDNVKFKGTSGEERDITLFKNLIDNNKGKPFNITASEGGTYKLRSPINERLAQWKKISTEPTSRVNLNTLRVLAIYKLLQSVTDGSVSTSSTGARGIGYEESQVMNINDFIQRVKPIDHIYLYIDPPGVESDLEAGVAFNGAAMIDGVPKADFALTLNGEPVYWISYKEGDYWSTDKETGQRQVAKRIPFSQYGEISNLYRQAGDEGNDVIVDAISRFCKSTGDTIKSMYPKLVYNTSPEELSQDRPYMGLADHIASNMEYMSKVMPLDKVEGLLNKAKQTVKGKQGGFSNKNITKFYILPSAFYTFWNFYEADKYSDLSIIALKGIYGNDYEPGAPFGVNNVNMLLQSNVGDISFAAVVDEEGDTIGYELSPGPRGHILLNPDQPDSEAYTPVLHARYTGGSVFTYNELDTGNSEALINCRTFIYPRGGIPGTAKELRL